MSKDPKFETNPNDENSKHQMRNRDKFKALKKRVFRLSCEPEIGDCTAEVLRTRRKCIKQGIAPAKTPRAPSSEV
jgi:hypothetical protein